MSAHAYRVPGDRSAARSKYFLYHNNSKSFREIRDGNEVGRTEGDLVYPDDPTVSRRQCKIWINGSEVFIEDLGGTNPTYVNTVPMMPGKRRRIRLNDVIEFGGQRLVLTHQDRHAPSNTEDVIRRRKQFRAVQKPDGSLTKSLTGLTGLIKEKTMVLVSRAQYRHMQLKRALAFRRRPPSVQVMGEGTRTVLVQRRSSILPYLLIMLTLSIAAVVTLADKIAP